MVFKFYVLITLNAIDFFQRNLLESIHKKRF